MRHRKEKRQLGRTTSHRQALLRNLVTSLLDKERIETTLAKAKELRRVADRMITLGKKGDLAARRRALRTIRSNDVVKKLFSDIALRYENRPGGYTRIYQIGPRPGRLEVEPAAGRVTFHGHAPRYLDGAIILPDA